MTIFEYMSLFRRISDFFEAQISEKKVSDHTFLQRERFKAIFGIHDFKRVTSTGGTEDGRKEWNNVIKSLSSTAMIFQTEVTAKTTCEQKIIRKIDENQKISIGGNG